MAYIIEGTVSELSVDDNFFTIKGNQMIDGIMGAEGSISQEDYFKEVEDLVMNGILIAEDGGMK